MYSIPWYVVVLQSIPEMVLLILVGFALYNLVLPIKAVFSVSIIVSTAVFFIRQFDIIFGLHTLIAVFLMTVLIKLLTKLELSSILFSSLTGMAVLGILQSILVPITFVMFSIDTKDLIFRPWLNILCFIPEALVMILGYWLIRTRHIFIIDLKERDKNAKSL